MYWAHCIASLVFAFVSCHFQDAKTWNLHGSMIIYVRKSCTSVVRIQENQDHPDLYLDSNDRGWLFCAFHIFRLSWRLSEGLGLLQIRSEGLWHRAPSGRNLYALVQQDFESVTVYILPIVVISNCLTQAWWIILISHNDHHDHHHHHHHHHQHPCHHLHHLLLPPPPPHHHHHHHHQRQRHPLSILHCMIILTWNQWSTDLSRCKHGQGKSHGTQPPLGGTMTARWIGCSLPSSARRGTAICLPISDITCCVTHMMLALSTPHLQRGESGNGWDVNDCGDFTLSF